jgi:hypothetical protein
MFPSPLSWNFKVDTLPVELQNSRRFLLDNPIAMRKNFLAVDKEEQRDILEDLERAVNMGHLTALAMLVKMFNWLDTLEPKAIEEITSLYDQSMKIERSITETLARMTQLADKRKNLQVLISQTDDIQLVSGDAPSHCISFITSFLGRQGFRKLPRRHPAETLDSERPIFPQYPLGSTILIATSHVALDSLLIQQS